MNALENVLAVFVAIFISFIIAYGIVNARNKIICLDHGYKHTDLTWNFKGYCIKRVDQTDAVISMEDL